MIRIKLRCKCYWFDSLFLLNGLYVLKLDILDLVNKILMWILFNEDLLVDIYLINNKWVGMWILEFFVLINIVL